VSADATVITYPLSDRVIPQVEATGTALPRPAPRWTGRVMRIGREPFSRRHRAAQTGCDRDSM